MKEEIVVDNPPTTLRRLVFRNFRNLVDDEVVFGPGFHLVHGRNAQGKTNLLEAIYLASSSRLLRSSRDAEAIRHGEPSASVEAELSPSETLVAIRLEKGARKKVLLNGMALKRASDVLGRLPCTVVSALDLEAVRGEPAERRLFLDVELSQLLPRYLDALARYRRALEQRNALLKTSRETYVANETFEPWEEAMAESGANIRRWRSEYLEALDRHGQNVHRAIAPSESLSIRYEPKGDEFEAEALLISLATSRSSDVARGSTTVGPHRDDVAIAVDGSDLRAFGSQGQQRSGAITLKCAAMLRLHSAFGWSPLLLLDDVFSDLDSGRRERLVEWVVGHAAQAILTCTEPDAAGKELAERATKIEVEGGRISMA